MIKNSLKWLIVIIFAVIILSYTWLSYYNSHPKITPIQHVEIESSLEEDEYELSPFVGNQNCFQYQIRNLSDQQIWDQFEFIVNLCEPQLYGNIIKYRNKDEDKYFSVPKNRSYECTIVTLGIGNDVVAERSMKTDFPACKFYGADPNAEINKPLYEMVGKYYPMAVAAETSQSISKVLLVPENKRNLTSPHPVYKKQTIEHISLPLFLDGVISQPMVDLLLIDIEGDEYNLFQFFYGSRNEIAATICQINIEVHKTKNPELKNKFAEFIRNIIRDGYYYIIKGSQYKGHNRVYLLSDDPKCAH